MLAFHLALWSGPANRSREAYTRFLAVMTDVGFGVLRRTLLQLASARALLERASKLWVEDHTHGDIDMESIGPNGAVARLRGHAFCELPQSRAAIAEVLRYTISLTRVRNVTEMHRLEAEGVMLLRFTWE
jgi:hypothetical protein